jgi:hypothetical protein
MCLAAIMLETGIDCGRGPLRVGPYLFGRAGCMETPWDEKVAQYLAGRSRATIEQVCLGIGLKYASSHDHGEIARAMENAG